MIDPEKTAPPPRASHDAWNAARYAGHSSLQEAMAAQVLAVLDLEGHERVLDIGCGDGRVSARIAVDRVPRGAVLGVDASADMIAFAQRTHGAVANLRFQVGDARRLGFDGAFDAAVSFNALHWVPEPAPALRGLRAALVPGGRAWLRLVTQGEVTSLETVAEQVRAEPAWASHFADFADPYLRRTPDEIAACAADAGLHVLALRTRLEAWDFGSRDAFLGFCAAGFGAWTGRLPADRRDEFVAAVLDRYLGLHAGDDGSGSGNAEGEGGATRFVFRFYQTDLVLRSPASGSA